MVAMRPAELVSGEFVLLMLGGGALVAAGAALVVGPVASAVVFGVASVLLLLGLRPALRRRLDRSVPHSPSRAEAVVGGTATVVARWGVRHESLPVGTRMRVDGQNVTALVHRTAQPARIDNYGSATGAVGARLHDVGIRAAVGTPIIVQGRLWGVMVAAQGIEVPLPADTEARVGKFADLAATVRSRRGLSTAAIAGTAALAGGSAVLHAWLQSELG